MGGKAYLEEGGQWMCVPEDYAILLASFSSLCAS